MTLAGLFAAGVVNGCASAIALVFDPKVVSTAQIVEAAGSKHDAFLGVHLITTVSLIRSGHTADLDKFVPLMDTAANGWVLQLLVSAGESARARSLFQSHYGEVEAAFSRMTDEVTKVLPLIGKRRFVVRIIPKGADYDNAWMSLAFSERSLGPLQFAVSGPESAIGIPSWANQLAAFLAHESTHSYFWFHKPAMHNTFSEEIVAYTVQRCVADRLSDDGPVRYPTSFSDMAKEAASESPSAFYQAHRAKFPDSLLAQFVANSMYDSKVKLRSSDTEARAFSTRFCRYVASSGIDFTTADDIAPMLHLRPGLERRGACIW